MGNSGGDNRAEFDTRIPHAIWYESPTYKGFNASVLFSPGQNRALDNSVLARAEPNCTGGNDEPCTDGGAGNQLSTALTYTKGPFYLVAGYEHHAKVNRTGDEGGAAGGIPCPATGPCPPPGSVGVADESAFDVGAQYTFKPTRTTVNFIYEKLKRYACAVPAPECVAVDPAFNERSRPNATWLAFTQQITEKDDFNVGWAHAGRTPGDPGGQINQPIPSVLNLAGPIDNRTNLVDAGLKHRFSKKMTTYFVFARQMNHQGAHYDLGANGHGAVVDREDAAGNSFTGRTHTAVSGGLTYDF
jgi:predicted porin